MPTLYFKSLSPLHIGTGKVLEPFDYVFHQEKIIILDQNACLERVFEVHPEAADKYVTWINETVQRMKNAKREAREARRNRNFKHARQHNQILSELRKNFNLVHFCEKELNDPDLAGEILSNSHYHKNEMYVLDRPTGTRQLREMIHINGEPYVPGSSIKGAIRTALAYRVVKNLSGETLNILINGKSATNIRGILEPLQTIRKLSRETIRAIEYGDFPKVEQSFKKMNKERHLWLRKIGDEVEKVVFGCGDGGNRLGEEFDDPKFDLLRLIKISDSMDGKWEFIAGHLGSFTRNNRTGQLNYQPIQYCQFLDENSTFSLQLEIDTQLISAILKNRIRGWTGFKEKFTTLFGVAPDLPGKELEKEVVNSILHAINEFAQAIIAKEKEWLQQFKRHEVKRLFEFYNDISGKENLLRVGFSSGWHSITVGLALSENPGLEEYLPEIIYAFNLDLIQNQEKLLRKVEQDKSRIKQQLQLLKRTPRAQKFPRSRRLIAENRRPYASVGWLQLSLKPFENHSKFSAKTVHKNNESKNYNTTNNESFQKKLEELKKKFNSY